MIDKDTMETFASTDVGPAGTVTTVRGKVLVDCGRSRLTALLEEAYELDDHVVVRLDDGEPEQVFLSGDLTFDGDPRELGSVDLGEPGSMQIDVVEQSTGRGVFTLTPVLECWMPDTAARTLVVTCDTSGLPDALR